MKVRAYNIIWDTDGETVDLPDDVIIDLDDDADPSLEGADYLSDNYGWCVISFNIDTVGITL